MTPTMNGLIPWFCVQFMTSLGERVMGVFVLFLAKRFGMLSSKASRTLRVSPDGKRKTSRCWYIATPKLLLPLTTVVNNNNNNNVLLLYVNSDVIWQPFSGCSRQRILRSGWPFPSSGAPWDCPACPRPHRLAVGNWTPNLWLYSQIPKPLNYTG